MPRAGTADRRRRRAGLAAVKPGKVGWVHGTKLKFFKDEEKAYDAAAELKTTGDFYSRMAQRYLEKYGYETPWEGDLEDDQDIADDVDPDEDVDELDPAVAEERATYFHILRGKIGVWYKAQYGSKTNKKKEKKMSFKKLFDKPALDPPTPVKPRVLHYYSRKFYHERIKDRVTARWAAASRLPKPPHPITVRNTVTKECWLGETEPFKKEVLEAIKNEHKAAQEAYTLATSGEVPTTPEGFNVALNNAAYYLQPFCDVIHERYGMNVSILMCGPVPERGGRVEVRSIHSGTTNDLVPRIWSDFDRAGFDAMQRSLVQFTHQCFTEADCRARSLNAEAAVGHVAAASQSAEVAAPQPEGEGGETAAGNGGNNATPPDGLQAGQSGHSSPDVTPMEDLLQHQLLSFDENLMSNPFNETEEDRLLTDMLATPGDQGLHDDTLIPPDLSDFLRPDNGPSTLFADDTPPRTGLPALGKALQAELAVLPLEIQEDYINRLEHMSDAMVEEENEMARTRLLIRRVDNGMSSADALALGSDEEEELEGTPEKSAGNSMERENPEGRAGVGSNTAGVSSHQAGPVARPRPRPRPVARPQPVAPALQSPETNRDAEGPLCEPQSGAGPQGVPQLERPETNRDAEGPLCEQQSGAEAQELARLEQPETNAEGGRPLRGGVPPTEQSKAPREIWDAVDREAWPTELSNAVNAFARGKEWGGKEWKECVGLLIALERRWGFPGKGLITAPAGGDSERPEEIPGFMQRARKWGSPVTLASKIGSRGEQGSFADRWWVWWKRTQPAERRTEGLSWELPAEVEKGAWDEIAKMHGRNGMLLYVGGLLWWGEAVAAEKDSGASLFSDWRLAVGDVARVLAEAVKASQGKKPSAEHKKGPEGKREDKRKSTSSSQEKENEPPRKRTRRSSPRPLLNQG
ncbi:hypothetical protein B0H11DRAFT_2235253 [Mycena galericulata]|nr:hypothetical protein B0H11DRAFT_2235253 [Mycena galericulata]